MAFKIVSKITLDIEHHKSKLICLTFIQTWLQGQISTKFKSNIQIVVKSSVKIEKYSFMQIVYY